MTAHSTYRASDVIDDDALSATHGTYKAKASHHDADDEPMGMEEALGGAMDDPSVVVNPPYHPSALTAEEAEEQRQNAQRRTITITTSPQTQVLLEGAAELLESIFAWLPMLELIKAARVCRAWKVMIKTSSVLQNTLFLKPVSDEKVYFNPDLEKLDGSGMWSTSPDADIPVQVCINPMVLDNPEHFLPDSSLRLNGVPAFNTLKEQKNCQRMLATNPPVAITQFWMPDQVHPGEVVPYMVQPADTATVVRGLTLVELHGLTTKHGKPLAFIPQLSGMRQIQCGMRMKWFQDHLRERQADLLREEVNRVKLKQEMDRFKGYERN